MVAQTLSTPGPHTRTHSAHSIHSLVHPDPVTTTTTTTTATATTTTAAVAASVTTTSATGSNATPATVKKKKSTTTTTHIASSTSTPASDEELRVIAEENEEQDLDQEHQGELEGDVVEGEEQGGGGEDGEDGNEGEGEGEGEEGEGDEEDSSSEDEDEEGGDSEASVGVDVDGEDGVLGEEGGQDHDHDHDHDHDSNELNEVQELVDPTHPNSGKNNKKTASRSSSTKAGVIDRDGDVKMEEVGMDSDMKPIALPTLLDASATTSTPAATPAGGAPSTVSGPSASTSTKPTSKAAKPKSTKDRPSSPPIYRPPPLQTVRLRITLGGPDNYEVDVAQMSRDTGQRPPSPVRKVFGGEGEESDESDEEDEGAASGKGKGGGTTGTSTSILGAAMAAYEAGVTSLPESALLGPGVPEKSKDSKDKEKEKSRKKKKSSKAKSDYYDVSDPFIDDSELALDDRKYFAQTKQAGFYVSSGEVALLKDKSPVKKPKSKKAPLTIHTHVVVPTPLPIPASVNTNADAGPSSLASVINANASLHSTNSNPTPGGTPTPGIHSNNSQTQQHHRQTPVPYPPASQSYTYPPVPQSPSHGKPHSSASASASNQRPPSSRGGAGGGKKGRKSGSEDAELLGTKDSPIALYSDGEGGDSDHHHLHQQQQQHHSHLHASRTDSNSSLPTALKSPGSRKRTVLVQGSRAEGVYPSEGSYSISAPPPTTGSSNGHSTSSGGGGGGLSYPGPQGLLTSSQGSQQQQIYWRFSLQNPLLGLGKERAKEGVQADPASVRKLAWGDRPEMRFVFDDGTGGATAAGGGDGGSGDEGEGEGGESGDESSRERDGKGGRKNKKGSGAVDNGVVVVGGGADKRKRYTTVVENGKKRKVVDITSFHPALHPLFNQLKAAIAAESWEVKGRFPQSIKPLLASVALTAIKLDEYDEHFFSLMPTLFMYNKFTMTKLIKRTVFSEHTAMIVERQEALLTQLKKDADEGLVRAQEEWEKSVVAWDKRQKKAKAANTLSVPGGGGGSGAESASNAPTRNPSPLDDHEHDHDLDHGDEDVVMHDASTKSGKDGGEEGKEGKGKEKAEQPPAKKYRMTESMKAIVWELVLLSNECCRLENEKNNLEGSVMQVSEQGLRKVLYQKIVSCFPSGWMNSGQISRDVSAMKKKLEKELEEEE